MQKAKKGWERDGRGGFAMRGFMETHEGTGHGEGLWESGKMGKTLSEE